MAYLEDAEVTSKRRIALIVVSGLLLVSMVVAWTVGAGIDKGFYPNLFSDRRGSSIDKSASTKAIKAVCQPTDTSKNVSVASPLQLETPPTQYN